MVFRHSIRMTALASWLVVTLIAVAATQWQTARAEFTTKIEHVVLLMFENRAFDHMFGYYPGVNGLQGTEFNLVNTSDSGSGEITVNNNSPYIGPIDPDHGTPATTSKIYGKKCLTKNCTVPSMSGFIEYEVEDKGNSVEDASSLLSMFTPDRVPIISTLADEFALFDRFFCSHPGPTWPNRLFQLMGTSQGDTETSVFNPDTLLYKGRTIFDMVEEAGHDWGFYFQDAPLEFAIVEKLAKNPLKLHTMSRFRSDANANTLPAFSWMNPRWFVDPLTKEGSSDQHPVHDVRLGEALMKDVYETLRNSPSWNSTLFIITYDEHGGFYDHVTPPQGVPAPDDSASFPDEGFEFTRLGIRIPTLLISPHIPKGLVISEPLENEKPAFNSEFDLTSIIATVKKLFNAPDFLTSRDAWAATFEDRLSTELRTDCPETLPDAPSSLGAEHALREGALPITDLQQEIIQAHWNLMQTRRDALVAQYEHQQQQEEAQENEKEMEMEMEEKEGGQGGRTLTNVSPESVADLIEHLNAQIANPMPALQGECNQWFQDVLPLLFVDVKVSGPTEGQQ